MSSTSSTNPQTRGRVDDRPDPSPSTSLRGAPPQSRLGNVPESRIKAASRRLARTKFPEDDDDDDDDAFLGQVWAVIKLAFVDDPKLEGQLADMKEFFANVKRKGKRDFINSLKAMAESDDWASLFEDDVFFKTKQTAKEEMNIGKVDPALVKATELAWNSKFQGNAEMVLFETIADLLDKNRFPYARLTSIVNSSGTGKSRMVDQLGIKIITVPMCLRSERTQGFPPPDGDLRHWLISGKSSDAQRRLHAFAYSLLAVTSTALETLKNQEKDVPKLLQFNPENPDIGLEKCVASVKDHQAWLASTFRDRMTSGQSFKIPNEYRKQFYNEVIESANNFMDRSRLVPREKEGSPARYVFENQGVEQAGEQLCRLVDPDGVLDSKKGPRWPLVVFAFDEAHVLTDNPPDEEWNLFLELRRILRQIHNLPIFSLFLSTAGRFNRFSPSIHSDPSNRVRDPTSRPLDPITEISFDDIAYLAPENTVTLDRVVQMDWISHLGRPLFGSRWDAVATMNVNGRPSETVVMDFAKQKLLDGSTELAKDDRAGSLACLSVRFALEFNMDGTARDVAYAQVERHMRLCVAATTGFEKLITIAGSEPLLAEAAYDLIKNTQTNAVRHLADHSDLNCIDRGRRGELVAALIIMHARDAARGASSDNRRWVTVAEFMKALLPHPDYERVQKSRPTFWLEGQYKPFEETFKDYGIWFNHVIKIEDSKMISVENLWKFVTRGAMIICSNNQVGIDILVPICDTKRPLSPETMSAMQFQIKNADRFQTTIDKTVFDGMSPVTLGIFPTVENVPLVTPKPVIRFVFALASRKAGVVIREGAKPKKKHQSGDFTSFDIWLAGLSTDTFGHIGADLEPYRILLERSLRPHDAFELMDDPLVRGEAKKLRGSRMRRMAPLAFSKPDHEAIHPPKLKSTATEEKGDGAREMTPGGKPEWKSEKEGRWKRWTTGTVKIEAAALGWS